MTDFLILVEGKHDEHFVCSMIELWFSKFPFKIIKLGGKDIKSEHEQVTKDEIQKGCKKVIIILDADNNFQETQGKIDKFKKSLNISDSDSQVESYLFPNNQENGNLETLLETIVHPNHKSILECFEKYETCLKEQEKGYKTPNQKAKIYAYLEAQVSTDEKCKEEKRDYKDEKIWNLKHQDLMKFQKFLKPFLNQT